MSQVTQLKTGAATGNADIEQYTYDNQTGLLVNQRLSKANTGAELMNLSYEYNRGNSNGTLNGKTGQMTRMIDNRERNRDRAHEFDSLGRLIKAKGGLAAGATGVTANWTQDYSYDRYGNKTGTAATGVTVFGGPVQRDGLPSMSYNTATNRMNSAGWEYDLAGNMTRGQNADGVWQRYEYDAAGRLKFVRNDAGAGVLENSYGASRQRIFRNEPGGSGFTWYVWGGDSVLAEYTSTSWGGTYTWAKSYIYAGSRLLFTATNNGAGGELKEYHHPDRLGTRMVTDPATNTLYLQSTLPFGTQFDSETTGSSNRLFTSYDRSAGTGLDYAVNRTYSPGQGRFTTVDPIGMASVSIGNPQSFNLFAYVRNAPTDLVDPSGLNLESPNVVVRIEKRVLNIERPDWFSTYWDDVFGANNGGGSDSDTGRRGPDDGGTVSTSSNVPTVGELITNLEKVLQNAPNDCKKLFEKNDALKKLRDLNDEGKVKIDGDVIVWATNFRLETGPMPLSETSYGAITDTKKKTITLNPNSGLIKGAFSQKDMDEWKARGMSTLDVATSVLMHEILHITGVFKPDAKFDREASRIDTTKSRVHQQELLDKCFPKKTN